MKWLIRIVVIVVLLVVVAAVAGVLLIDSIATAAVREGAAFATQTDVELEKVDVHLSDTAADITGLDIKNPDGPFRERYDSFLVLDNGTAQVTASSIRSDLIEIPRVELDRVTVSVVREGGEANYETILESLQRFQGEEPPPGTEDETQVVIKELIITNITVDYYFEAMGLLGEVGPNSLTIDKIVMTDVGAGGVPISQVTADIITDIMVQVTANLANELGDEYAGHVKGLADTMVQTIGEAEFLATAQELGLEVGDTAAMLGELGIEVSDEALEAVGDILGEGAGAAEDVINQLPGLNRD